MIQKIPPNTSQSPADVRRLWISRLAANAYTMGRRFLTAPVDQISSPPVTAGRPIDPQIPLCHCVLGALCDLGVQAGVIPAPVWGAHDYAKFAVYEGQQIALPNSIMDWAGLNDPLPEVALPVKEIRKLGIYSSHWRPEGDRGVVSLSIINDDYPGIRTLSDMVPYVTILHIQAADVA